MTPDSARKASTWQERVFRALQALEQARGQRVPQEEIAELVGRRLRRSVGQTTIGRWIRGEVIPDLAAIAALAHVLGTTPEWLAWGRGEPPTLLYPPTEPAASKASTNNRG